MLEYGNPRQPLKFKYFLQPDASHTKIGRVELAAAFDLAVFRVPLLNRKSAEINKVLREKTLKLTL